MKDYYHILGVSRTSHSSEIKRAYRRLVQQLHPDVNPDPLAHERIREINEAYEVLGDESKRSDYDYRLDNPISSVVVEQPPPHRDPAYRRRTYRPPQPAAPTQRDLMERLLKYVKPVTWTGCLVCILLCVDYFLPRSRTVETIMGFKSQPVRRGWQEYVVTEQGRELKVSVEDIEQLAKGQELVIVESGILHIVLSVEATNGTWATSNLATLYGNFVFVPVLLGIVSALALFPVGSVEFRFNLAVVNIFVLIFTLILMLK